MQYPVILRLLAGFSLLVVSAGCSGYAPKPASTEVIYRVSEQEALELAHWAVAQVLPEQTIHRLSRPRIGFFVHERSRPDMDMRYAWYKEAAYIYEVDLLRVQGVGHDGAQVDGYAFTVRGQGGMKTGPDKLARIEKQIEAVFEQSGRAVAVTAVSERKAGPPVIASPPPATEKAGQAPGTPGPAIPSAESPDAPAIEQHPAEDDVFKTLEKLKDLHDKGVITREEFELKKKELLERI